jgi:hypothetical protein
VESITTVATTPALLDSLAIVADKELWGSFVWSALFGAEQMLWVLLIGSLSGACGYTRVVVEVHVGDGSKC